MLCVQANMLVAKVPFWALTDLKWMRWRTRRGFRTRWLSHFITGMPWI